jgi:hypothetical protein
MVEQISDVAAKEVAILRRIFLLFAVCAASGCTTTEQAAQALHSKWEGQPVDSFFVQNGPPVSSYAMVDGGKIFTWIGGRTDIPLPGSASTATNVIGNTAISTTTFQEGSDLKLGCRVQIVTNLGGVITTIKPVGDTIGMWQTSRCAEIFGVKPG